MSKYGVIQHCSRFLWLPFFILISALPLLAQDSNENIDCETATRLRRPKKQLIVSGGVINGKAKSLVKPEYPSAARAVNVRGSVNISVLIDPRGCVSEASVVSGHPFLRASAMKAALRCQFHPFLPGGPRVWLTGTIIYNFVSDHANWLELGYFSSSPQKLLLYLPTGFDGVRADLKLLEALSYDQEAKAVEAVLEKIRFNLNDKPKYLWLFDVGSQLSSISAYRWVGRDGLKELVDKLRSLMTAVPAGVEPALITRLNRIIDESTSPTMWQRIKELEELTYHLGN